MSMDNAGDIIEAVAQNISNNAPHSDSDYIGEDGLLYCGGCQTPKQFRMELCGELRTLPKWCDCRQKIEDERKQQEEKVAASYRAERLRQMSMMDREMFGYRFENADMGENEKSLKQCRRYAEKFAEMKSGNRGLLLIGDVGTGKTFAAACIANEIINRGYMAVMISLVKVVDSEVNYYADRIANSDLIIFDDLGAERTTDFAMEKVYAAVDARYRSGKPVIYTTNLPLGELKHSDDIRRTRIYDRILERCFPIQFVGVSRRKREARRGFEVMSELLNTD